MARKTIETRLAELEAQKKTLKARLGKQERAQDTRRKVLLGALVLHRLEHSQTEEFSRRLRDWLRRELPGFLTRDADKELLADLIRPLGPEPTGPVEAKSHAAAPDRRDAALSPEAARGSEAERQLL